MICSTIYIYKQTSEPKSFQLAMQTGLAKRKTVKNTGIKNSHKDSASLSLAGKWLT